MDRKKYDPKKSKWTFTQLALKLMELNLLKFNGLTK